MDDANSKGKHATTTNIHTQVMQCFKIIFSTAFTLLSFVGPNWLYVRSNFVHGLTYDKLIEKKLFASFLWLPVGYQMYETWVEGKRPHHCTNPGLLKFNKAHLLSSRNNITNKQARDMKILI